MITNDREYRSLDLVKSDKEMVIEGKAATFNDKTILYTDEYGNPFYEVIAPEAIRNADISDVVLNQNHQGSAAAKTKNGTLKLSYDNSGLYIKADLSKNQTGRDLWESVKAGFYDKMSFAFQIAKGGYNYDQETRTRTITKIEKIFDCSLVDFAAYQNTTVAARSFFEAAAEAERAIEEKRKRLLLLTKIG